MSRGKTVFLGILPCAIVIVVATQMYDPHRWGMYIDTVRQVGPVSFYGQLVTSEGVPIADATVRLRITKPNYAYILGARSAVSHEIVNVSTDTKGNFRVTGQSGRRLMILSFETGGKKHEPIQIFAGTGRQQPRYQYAGFGMEHLLHKADPTDPVVFQLRPDVAEVVELQAWQKSK